MLFSKVARQIIALVPFVAVAINLPLENVGRFFSELESQGDLVSILELALFYLIILIIYLLLYEIILRKLWLSTSLKLEDIGERAVYNEDIDRAILMVRFNYLATRVYRFLNLGQVTYGYPNENMVWKGLNKASISRNIVAIFKFLISIPMLTSLALSCISLHIFSFSNLPMDRIQDLMIQSLNLRVDLVDLASKLPLVATLLALVPTVFFFYFYSQKRDVRKIIDKERNKHLEESVLLYEKLMLWIDKNLYDISNNYDYVVGVQNSIVSLRMEKRVPNYFSLVSVPIYGMNKINNFQFIDLPEVDDFTQIVNELLSDNLDRYSRLIAYRNYDLWELYWGISSLNESEKVHRSFYTRSGVEGYISGIAELPHDINKEMFEEERKYESSILASDIYKKFEILYSLKRGSEALRKYLYSSRTEKVLVRVLQKEKQ
ncbi:hypothetical protein [uncultured Rothia sp.]|uniref:hypothetical protein n=1 Tax=uncultured Rothia sp. TaxID=316088 RepID=UPI00288B297E|nr:hypothetical protein [uncultured Rothia sp.]